MIIPYSEIEGLTPPEFDEVETPQPENLVPASIAPMKMREDLSPAEEFGRGLGRGWEQVKGLGAGVVGMAGAATGIDGLEEWGYNKAQEKMQAAAAPELEGGVGSIFNVESPSDFVNYAAGVMGEQAPNLALSLMGGGLGGAVGKRAVSAAVTEALEAKTAELVAGGLARKVATERAKLELVEGLGQNMTASLAAERAAQIAAMKTGVGVGGAAMGIGMETSSIYNDTRDLGLAVKYGVPAGLIEGVADRYFGGKILDALNPATEVGAQVAKAGIGKTLGTAAAEVGAGALIEGPLEEVPQTRLEQMARAEADPNYDINSDASTRELVEAGAAGAVMGGGMAGGIEAAKFALAPMTMRAQGNIEGLPDGTTPAPLTPEEQAKKDAADLEGLYNFDPNPVVIDDGDGEIVARKFDVGGKKGWAIENPTDEQRALLPSIPGDRVAITPKSIYGAGLMHTLNQGGRIRRTDNSITDPSILGNKVEDESEWQGYDPNVQSNDLSGDQTGKSAKLDGELAMTEEGQKLALENAVLAPYKELRNVFNAVDMLDSTFDPEIQASLLQDAVTLEEIEVAKSQLATAIAGAKTEEEINTLGELEQKISDFESTRILKQATVPKSGTPTTPFFERDAEGNLNRVQRDTNADSERAPKAKLWADTVEQNAKAQADLDAARKLKANFDTGEDEGGVFTVRAFDADKVVENTLGDFSSGRSDFRSDYFDGLETYEMMQSDRADLQKKLKASKDPEVTKELTAKLAELEDATNSLNENLSRNDLFSRAVNSKISEAEGAEKNKAKLEQLRTLEAELQNLQSSRNGLITDEERSDFDASEDGSRLDALQFEVSSTRNSLISPKARAEIYKKAQAEVAAKRDEVMATREAEKAPREFVNAEERDAAARAEQHATWVYYTDPKTKFRMHGKLVADLETGKATNAAGNFLLVPDTDGFKKGTTGLSDLNDTRQYGAEAVELNPSQMANVAPDKNKLMALEEARNAKAIGVEDTENKTPIQNATAAAQKQNELNKIQEEQRDNGLVPVDVVKLKRGDRVGLKFPDQEKVARTVYLNDGTQLVPTSAGIFSGTQTVNGERQAVFNRYYIARPKNAKGPSYLNSVTIPNLKKGESLITLNDISEEDKAAEGLKKNEAGVWQTGENVNEDLWGNFYKAPASATFASAVVEKKGGVEMPALTTGRQGTSLKVKVGDKFQAESLVSDLTDAEQVLTLLLGKLSPNPTPEELLAIGLDQTDEVAELESPRGKLEVVKIFNSEIDDTLSKSGLKIPVKVGLLSDKKNPNTPLQVRMFASFNPSLVLEAMQNLQDKKDAPKSQQKEGNIVIAQKALDNEIQDLKRLTLAQMNMGLDVRVQEVNGIPQTQMLEGLGFTASRSNAGIKKNDFGKHIITRLEYSPNSDYVRSERVYTRTVQTVGKSQRQAAESLKDETAGGRGLGRKKVGLGVANEVLENFRRMQLERAQDAKEREAQDIQKGSDLATRHGEALAGLTAFTRPIFEKYVGPIRAHILDSENPIELKDRWQMESELRLARELNKVQRAAMPLSVSEELERQRKTIEANANKLEPVQGKKRIRKKGKQFGELKDDPYQSKRQFERLHREWKQDLEQELANVDAKFFRQMLPRALRGKSGVAEMNRVSKEMSELEESLRKGISGMTVSVAADPEEVKAAVAKDKTIARLTKDFNAAAGKGAKERVKLKIESRKSAIEQSAIKERPLSKQEIETELNKQLKGSSAYAQLNRKLEKMGELDSKQSAILDKFLDYVEAKGAKLKDESIKAATERIRTLLGRQKEARAGGRQMYVDVRKETEKAESASAKREAKNEGADAESLISENDFTAIQDEEVGNAIKAMDYAAFTENDDLFQGAANAYAALLDKKKQSYTEADKELIKAFGRIMDRVKALNVFGFGRVPGVVKQGFVEASKFKGAIEKQTFVDPQTGEAAGMDSALMGDIIKGQADPLANARMPEERLSSDEAKSQYLKDLAYRKLDQLARVKLNGFDSEVDQNLVELAFVKLFGGEFNGEVDGVEINKTFEPLDEKYTDVLNDFFAGTTANEEKANIARIVEARGGTPLSDKDRQELTKGSRKIAATANNILDKYLFDISPVQASLGVPGAPLASLAQASTGASMARTAASPDIAQSNRDATALPKARVNAQGLESSLTQAIAAEKIAAEDVKTAQSSSEKAAAINALNRAKDNRISAEMKVVEYTQSPTEEVQTFVQAYAGLSDSDMVALDDREIGAIYQAATSKADADMAVGAMDAVVAALPSMQQIENMTGGQLMSAYLADVKAQNDRGVAEKVLQDNLKNAANARMFRSNTAFLEHVASMPKGINRATALRAKEFLKLNDKGSFNWNKIGTQIASFGKNGKQVNWAGVTGKDSTFKGGLAMYVNLDAVHDGNIVQTMLEEMDHVLTHQIINAEEYGITLNPTQAGALERLQVAYKKAVLKAGEGMTDLAQAAEGLTPEQKVKFYADGLLTKASENPEQFRAYYNLTNLDEFVVGVKKDPAFLDLMKELGFNDKVDGGFSLSKFLKDIFHALAELVTGRRLDPASELARVFADSWTLSTGRDAKQFAVSPTQLSMALGIEGSGDTASTKKTGRTENVRMRQGNDGAVYNLSLVKEDDGSWSVAYEHGTPPRKLQQGKKNKVSLSYEQAKNMFDKTVAAKAKKYTIIPDKGPDGGSSATSPSEGPMAPAPQSLTGSTQRWNALTADLKGRNLTQADIDAWKKANPEKYAELEKMREDALKSSASSNGQMVFGPVWHVTSSPEGLESNAFDPKRVGLATDYGYIARGIYFGGSEQKARNSVKYETAKTGKAYRLLLNLKNPLVLNNPQPPAGNWQYADAKKLITEELDRRITPELWNEFSNRYPETPSPSELLKRASRSIERGKGPLDFWASNGPLFYDELYEYLGIDGIVIKHGDKIWEAVGLRDESVRPRGNFNVSQIKSAEPLNLENGRLIPPSEWAQPENPNILYSLPGALSRAQVSKLLTGSTESTTYTGTKVKTGGWFASDAKAPNGVDAIYDRSVDRKALGEEKAQYMATALQKALKRFEKAGNPVNIDDVQTALGTIENPLTEDQFAGVNELMLTNREEEAAVLKSEYMKENIADFRARQAAASARLPESIAQIVGEMRDVIDPMSRYVDEAMGFSVKENEGVYLNRTYLNFADEKTRAAHQKNVRENAKVMEDLKNYVSRQLADREAGLLVRAATRRGEVLYIEEATKIAQAGLTEADLAAGMEQYLNYGGDGIGRVFMSGKIPGQKNLKILDSRGNVAPELQAAWGVVKDPVVNYVNTTMKLSALVANDRLLRELKDVGMESGMLYDPRDPANLSESDAQIMKNARAAALEADPFLASNARFKPELLDRAMVAQDPEVKSILERSEAQIPAGYVKLSADTNKSLAPISGMYAEANFAKWMFEKFPAKGEDPLWLQGLLKATFIPMAMKTVGSVSGHFRNYYAGYMSLVAAGNFNPLDAQWRKDVAEAHALTFGRMLDSASDADKRKAMMKGRAKLGELGLLNQSVMQNFMGDLAKFNSTSENGFKTFLRKVTQAYGASDDAFKIIHYFSELGKYRRAFPDMPIEQVEQKAAQIARDVHQTYGDTFAAVKNLKKIPVIAPFISFTSEVIRNSINLVRLAHSEISEGRRTGNRELMSIGLSRVRGMLLASGGTFAIASMFAAMAGVSGDEERDLRRLLPDWQKNSQLLFFGKSNGKISFMDFSFTDPFTYLKKPVIALARELYSNDDRLFNERLADGVMGAVSELTEPFLGDQLFSGALLELKANKDSSGRSIYNPQDSAASIAANITGHIANVFTPGSFDTAGRIIKAARGVVSDSGRSYDLGNEVMSAAGVRASEMDVRQSLGFKAKRFMQDYRDASSLFTGALLSRGTRSGGDVASGYNKANDAIRELSEDFRQTYIGAMRLGVPQKEVISALKANGISDETIKMLQTGKIKPYEASKQAIKKAQESGAKDRVDAYNRTYAATKKY